MKDLLQKVLVLKEKHQNKINSIFFENQNILLLTLNLNIPGWPKKKLLYKKFFNVFKSFSFLKSEKMVIKKITKFSDSLGYHSYALVTSNLETKVIKEKLLKFEYSLDEYGKIIDIDLYKNPVSQVKRNETSFQNLKTCFLCNESAIICTRQKTHELKMLRGKVDELIKCFLKNKEELICTAQNLNEKNLT